MMDEQRDLEVAREVLRSVDLELDHARVRRTVREGTQPRSAPSWRTPLAAAALVACVLLTSVGALAWRTSQGEPRTVDPAAASPAPDVLAAEVRDAVGGGDVACVRATFPDGGRAELLHDVRSGRSVVSTLLEGEDVRRARWPGCGPQGAATDLPTRAPSAPGSTPLDAGVLRKILIVLLDPRSEASGATATGLTLQGVAGSQQERLLFTYELDPDTTRPVNVRLALAGGDDAGLRATITWFARGSTQDQFLRAHGHEPAGSPSPTSAP